MFFNFRPYELLSFINYFTFDRCSTSILCGIPRIETLSTVTADESREACNSEKAEAECHFINYRRDHDQ
jgi:hypothetical protein